MSAEFDPYKTWLDIENKTASTTHYKLLGLTEFESDKDRITAAADKAIRKIRSQKPGDHTAEWSKILDEIQEVKALLLDDQKKGAYDDDLRFADEFVRELEGGIKRDPAAAAVAAAPKKSETRPVKQDPRYPPGMVPKGNSAPPSAKTTSEEVELRVSPSPNRVDRKDSPFYPPSRPTVERGNLPSTEASPTPAAPAPEFSSAPITNDLLPPGVASSPPPESQTQAQAPMPDSPAPNYAPQPGYYQPQQPASPYQAQPAGYSAAPSPYQQPGGYPQQPNPYSQQPGPYQPQPSQYPQPTNPYQQPGYPQNYYPPQGGQAPIAAYPIPQAGYGYGAPMPPPMGYGGPPMPSPYGGMPPMATPMYGAPMAVPMAPQAYMPPQPPAPAALDPMAPVAIPGTAVASGQGNPAPIAMPYGAPMASAAMMQPPTAAIPVGTAVGGTEASLANSSPATSGSNAVEEPAKVVRSSSATSVMLAAKREKSSQQTLMFAGIGGLLLVVVAVLGFMAASGNLGSNSVANNPGKTTHNSPAVTPDKSPSMVVPPVIPTRPSNPPVKPEPTKPEPAKPTKPSEPDNTKAPETKPMTEMPAEPKPEIKPEPPKPEPTKPEPTKPETPKPEPAKPEPKPDPEPEIPAGEMPSKEELVQLGKALQDAKAAMGEFNFAEADAELAKAEKLAKLPDHKSKLARLKEVKGLVKQFHDRLVQAATGMDGGESFKVGTSTMIAMIEANQKQVILRVAGQNKTYQYSDLPIGLARALADMKLDGTDPVSRVVKGAYVAVHRSSTPSDLQVAKSWWEEATLGGADVTHLMPFLTDSYDLIKDFEKVKKDEGAAKPAAKEESEKGVPKAAPDAKAILEGKS